MKIKVELCLYCVNSKILRAQREAFMYSEIYTHPCIQLQREKWCRIFL